MENVLTVKQYADLRGITPQAVNKAIRKGHNLPGVQKKILIGKTRLVRVSAYWIRKNKDICEN